ncbi:uncharacterized protein LOC110699240 [Chenopodium quinoa]|uniref:uncharacterized protein LOC110699240 n=1 Tax=Chenopodium quinoa TaxID=63459 RepID=UPI000B7897C5|nr:uncharacterized protein LOC110699240 [Chenopodium quinoa]
MMIGKMFNQSIFKMLMLVLVCCMIVVVLSMFKLPDVSIGKMNDSSKIRGIYSKNEILAKFGEMMVGMLPDDLAFTVFVPSEKAFERDLGLRANHSYDPKELDNVYATVSHVLGFSTIPRKIYTDLLPDGKGLSYDSISGFALYISKDFDGVLVVNRVRAKQVNLKRGEVVVHIMDGVVMDAEFEQSVKPADEDEMAIKD